MEVSDSAAANRAAMLKKLASNENKNEVKPKGINKKNRKPSEDTIYKSLATMNGPKGKVSVPEVLDLIKKPKKAALNMIMTTKTTDTYMCQSPAEITYDPKTEVGVIQAVQDGKFAKTDLMQLFKNVQQQMGAQAAAKQAQ